MKSPKELEDLTTLVSRLKNHPRSGNLSIAASNQAIVLPILQNLGWDISNIDEVAPEFSKSGHAIYYTLRIRNSGLVFLNLLDSSSSPDDEPDKLTVETSRKGIRLFTLTNGKLWTFFLVSKEGEKWWSFLNSKNKNEGRIARKFITLDLAQAEARELATLFYGLLSKEQVQSGAFEKLAASYYEESLRDQRLEESLPRAWNQLIREPSEAFAETVASATEKLCGIKPKTGEVMEFIKRQRDRLLLALPLTGDPQADLEGPTQRLTQRAENSPSQAEEALRAVLRPQAPESVTPAGQTKSKTTTHVQKARAESTEPTPTITAEKPRPPAAAEKPRSTDAPEEAAPPPDPSSEDQAAYSSILMNWARKLASEPRFRECQDKKAMKELLREMAGKDYERIPADEIVESAGNIYFFTIRPNLRKVSNPNP